jgi:hypothetical protein
MIGSVPEFLKNRSSGFMRKNIYRRDAEFAEIRVFFIKNFYLRALSVSAV